MILSNAAVTILSFSAGFTAVFCNLLTEDVAGETVCFFDYYYDSMLGICYCNIYIFGTCDFFDIYL